MESKKIIKLGRLIEDPDNASEAIDEEIARLAEKIKRVPQGLTAMRIAYVTDDPSGKWKVISGNKRLRVLKAAYGENGECPAEWFQDVTAMSESERHEFRLDANITDGHWNVEKLLAQYDREELGELMGVDAVEKLLASVAHEDSFANIDDFFVAAEEGQKKPHTIVCPKCGEKIAV